MLISLNARSECPYLSHCTRMHRPDVILQGVKNNYTKFDGYIVKCKIETSNLCTIS